MSHQNPKKLLKQFHQENFFTDKLLFAMHNWSLTNLQKKNKRNVRKSFALCLKRNVQLNYFIQKQKKNIFPQFYLSKIRMQLWETCCNFSTERPNFFHPSKRLFQTIFPKKFSQYVWCNFVNRVEKTSPGLLLKFWTSIKQPSKLCKFLCRPLEIVSDKTFEQKVCQKIIFSAQFCRKLGHKNKAFTSCRKCPEKKFRNKTFSF